jgi:hypothetical protein
MFITHSSYRRDALGRGLMGVVNDRGLGIVVTETTRFDPTRMKARFIYWLDTFAAELAGEARSEMQKSFNVQEDPYGKWIYRNGAIKSVDFNAMASRVKSIVQAKWSQDVPLPKMPSAAETYAKMGIQMAVSFALPWVGITWAVTSMFGKSKPKMAVPWNAVYGTASPYAQEATIAEESNRIAEEGARIQQEQITATEKSSQVGARFQLPEGVTAIKHGALVMALKGPSVETKIAATK